jgi:hypothetical protein
MSTATLTPGEAMIRHLDDLGKFEQATRPDSHPLLDEFVEAQSGLINRFSERAYYRDRALTAFFNWERDELPGITRRDPSAGYEAFHERRLALGLSEEQVKTERDLYIARIDPVNVCDLF